MRAEIKEARTAGRKMRGAMEEEEEEVEVEEAR